jgi:hypothetical protein
MLQVVTASIEQNIYSFLDAVLMLQSKAVLAAAALTLKNYHIAQEYIYICMQVLQLLKQTEVISLKHH